MGNPGEDLQMRFSAMKTSVTSASQTPQLIYDVRNLPTNAVP